MKIFCLRLLLIIPIFAGGIACGWWLKPSVPSAPPLANERATSALQTQATSSGKVPSEDHPLDWSQQNSSQRRVTLSQILKLPHPDQRLAEFITRLRMFDADDVLNAIAMIKAGDKQGMSFPKEWMMLIEHWGRMVGVKALDGGFDEFGGNPTNIDWFRKIAIGGWAEQDPLAAVTWLDAHPEQNDWLGCFVALSNGIGRTDPDLAAAILTGSLHPEETNATWVRNESVKNLVDAVARSGGLEGMKSWLERIPVEADGGLTRREAFYQVVTRLRHASADEAESFLQASAGQPWRNDLAYSEFTQKLAQKSPQQALDWAAALPASPATGSWPGCHGVYQEWLQRDAVAAATWLQAQPAGAFRERLEGAK